MTHLYDLLTRNRAELIESWTKEESAVGRAPSLPRTRLLDGVLDELAQALRRAVLGPSDAPSPPAMTAEGRGRQRFGASFDVTSVVREYGILQRCILDLVEQHGVTVSLIEHRVLSAFTNEAAAQAVAEFMRQRDEQTSRSNTTRAGVVAHELRNPLSSAVMAFGLLRTSPEGAERDRLFEVLGRNLKRLEGLITEELGGTPMGPAQEDPPRDRQA
jgi:signal transduction histidine kinase